MPWFETVAQLAAKGQAYVLMTIMGVSGSTPRNSGTKMVVTFDGIIGQSTTSFGTIGGGHLEFKAIAMATTMLQEGQVNQQAQQRIEHFPLGAKLGQCCGGQATILFESFVGSTLNIMLFGAGHVGKALAGILAQLPCRLHWVDNRASEFPTDTDIKTLGGNVIKVLSDSPADEVAAMPANSYFIIMTHNHGLDFDISEAAVKRNDARYIGLIGSATKWQRFKMRFEHRDINNSLYQQISCPVGLSQVPGKLPIEVAVSIAGEVINNFHQDHPNKAGQQGVHWHDLKSLARDLTDVAVKSAQQPTQIQENTLS
ncbi:MAG: xanthine dehydrogenase accessory protein XdhC [Colwellia sp.]|nr:xanthine dehydrogenase accessory protein XdhC [Colwellia sp.]